MSQSHVVQPPAVHCLHRREEHLVTQKVRKTFYSARSFVFIVKGHINKILNKYTKKNTYFINIYIKAARLDHQKDWKKSEIIMFSENCWLCLTLKFMIKMSKLQVLTFWTFVGFFVCFCILYLIWPADDYRPTHKQQTENSFFNFIYKTYPNPKFNVNIDF